MSWGADATDWAQAVTTGMLQKAGGLFQLLSEVDFGTAYGVKALYLKSRSADIADAGQIRLARADVINWRNNANSANLSLTIDSNDVLTFDGAGISVGGDPVQTEITVSDTATIDLSLVGANLTADIKTDSITNAMIASSAGIAFSKLEALTSGQILIGSGSNVATAVSISGDISINNTGVAAIGANKVANSMLSQVSTATFKGRATAGTGNVEDLSGTQATSLLSNFVGDSGSGGTKGLVPAPATGDSAAGKFLKADGNWTVPSGGGDVAGPGSATDNGFARFDGTTGKVLKNSAATVTNSDVAAAAGIAANKLAALTASRAVVSDSSGFLAAATTTATEIGYVAGVTSSIQTQLNSKTTIPSGSDQQLLKLVSGVPAFAWQLSAQQTLSSAGSVLATSDLVFLNATSGAFTATLPSATGQIGKQIILKKTDSTFNAVTVGSTTLNTVGELIVLVSDNTNWQVVSRAIPSYLGSQAWTDNWANTTTQVELWRFGNTVRARGLATVTGTTTNSNYSVTIPSEFTATGGAGLGRGDCFALITGTGGGPFIGIAFLATVNLFTVSVAGAGGAYVSAATMSQTIPITWANGDYIDWTAQWSVVGWNS